MMVVVVSAILLTVAIPSMQDVLQRNAQQAVIADLSNTLAFARSEAISRGQIISICQSTDGTSCSTVSPGNWSNGWIVFVDPVPPSGGGIAAVVDTDEQVLRVHGPARSGTVVSLREGIVANDARASIRIDRTGFLNSVGPTQALFTVCRQSGGAAKALGIFVNAAGRVSFTRDSDGNGIQDFQSGGVVTDLAC